MDFRQFGILPKKEKINIRDHVELLVNENPKLLAQDFNCRSDRAVQ